MSENITLTSIPGLLVGHATDPVNRTGCTAVLCPEGFTAGLDVRGHAPGTRETDSLGTTARVDEIHGLVLSGGSAFGLAAATGVVRWLTEQGRGLQTLCGRVPLVPAAVIFDLFYNQTLSKPDEAMGYEAALAASGAPVAMGNVGAGTGATSGKLAGFDRAMKTGLGSAGIRYEELIVAAMVVLNPVGDVLDHENGKILAGVRSRDGGSIVGSMESLPEIQQLLNQPLITNTVLAVVATNAVLDKVQTTRVARMASAALGRCITPAHTIYDGDVVFSLSAKQGPKADESVVGALAAESLARAVKAGALAAESIPGCPAFKDMAR